TITKAIWFANRIKRYHDRTGAHVFGEGEDPKLKNFRTETLKSSRADFCVYSSATLPVARGRGAMP
ncbi:MAG: hypothetical protein K2K97_02025, partial [Muribaculaceae bacterium]|nr:hypothetical protein [Muribaculaceae bacterium]